MEDKIILASGSPRRSEILTLMGIPFEIDAADVDETCEGTAREVVLLLAERKALAVAERHPDRTVLAADTVVESGGILGKPHSEDEAIEMLRRLSGHWHTVYTGVCVVCPGQVRTEVAETRVHFTPLTNNDILRYVRTGDPMDKAGAYAIQGMAGMFIDRIEGCPHNVVGLPMALVKKMLTY